MLPEGLLKCKTSKVIEDGKADANRKLFRFKQSEIIQKVKPNEIHE